MKNIMVSTPLPGIHLWFSHIFYQSILFFGQERSFGIFLLNMYLVFFLKLGFLFLQDEICKSIAENGGIDALLQCIDESGEQGNKTVARVCCSLLSKV